MTTNWTRRSTKIGGPSIRHYWKDYAGALDKVFADHFYISHEKFYRAVFEKMHLIDLITWLNELNEGLLVIILNDIFSVADAW